MKTRVDPATRFADYESGEMKTRVNEGLVVLARQKYSLRRRRNNLLPQVSDLFHDPAWDILLDLFIAAETDAQISESSACIASGVPPTTALRAIGIMEQRGIIRAGNDPFDARRRFVSLSDVMRQQMRALLNLW
jgi:hypothetical protein